MSSEPPAAERSLKNRQSDAKKKQSGEMAPDVDQDGKMINPHNPDFITKVPWYLGNSGQPTLKHHNIQKSDHFLTLKEADQIIYQNNLDKLSKQIPSQKVFKKGSCKNCGATTHAEKDCVERPRSQKKAAWKSGLDIAPDEVVLKLEEYGKVNFAAKRDQWKGYDPEEYQEVVERHQRIDSERRKQKQELKELKRIEDEQENLKKKSDKKIDKKLEKDKKKSLMDKLRGKSKDTAGEKGGEASASDGSDSDSDSDSDYDSDEDDEDDEREFIAKDKDARDFQSRQARQGGVGGNELKVTVRNLRIREDTPKYLRNLDLESAHYDPKARSMRANPFPNENPEDLAFAGDNFIRHTGDALTMAQTQVLCWEMQNRGEDVDLLSNPSQAELMHKKFRENKVILENERKKSVLEKYGAGNTKVLDPRLKMGQTEVQVEYSRDGRVLKGPEKASTRTKYEEDVHENNHTSVFGSFWSRVRGQWGYSCCHSLMKNSYCTGDAGRTANDAANGPNIDQHQARKMIQLKSQAEKDKASTAGVIKRSDIFGESAGGAGLDDQKVLDAVRREEEWAKKDHTADADDRKRGYNSMQSIDVTLEDMEAYRLKRMKKEDPMAAFNDSEELLEYDPKARRKDMTNDLAGKDNTSVISNRYE